VIRQLLHLLAYLGIYFCVNGQCLFLNKPRLHFKLLKSTSSSNHKVRGSRGKKRKEKSARHQFSVQKTSIKPTNYFIRRREKKLETTQSRYRIINIEWNNRVTGGRISLCFILALKCCCFTQIIIDNKFSEGKHCSIHLQLLRTIQTNSCSGKGQKAPGAGHLTE